MPWSLRPGREAGRGCEGRSPEHHSVVEVTDGSQAGDRPLRGKAGLHEGPRVEHAQEPVDDDLGGWQWDPRMAGLALLGPDPLAQGPL